MHQRARTQRPDLQHPVVRSMLLSGSRAWCARPRGTPPTHRFNSSAHSRGAPLLPRPFRGSAPLFLPQSVPHSAGLCRGDNEGLALSRATELSALGTQNWPARSQT